MASETRLRHVRFGFAFSLITLLLAGGSGCDGSRLTGGGGAGREQGRGATSKAGGVAAADLEDPAQREAWIQKRIQRLSAPQRHLLTRLERQAELTTPLQTTLGEPGPDDWRFFYSERERGFREYVADWPTTPTSERRTLYLLVLGDLSPAQQTAYRSLPAFLEAYFGLPVRALPSRAASTVPASLWTEHPEKGHRQILVEALADEVLRPALPKDASALLAITALDLNGGPGRPNLFGQARLHARVGAISLARLDPAPGKANAASGRGQGRRGGQGVRRGRGRASTDGGGDPGRLLTLRLWKAAAHELTHMMSVQHCSRWACNMNGRVTVAEFDRMPIHLCPTCLPKLWYATGVDPQARFDALARIYEAQGLHEEATHARAASARVATWQAPSAPPRVPQPRPSSRPPR